MPSIAPRSAFNLHDDLLSFENKIGSPSSIWAETIFPLGMQTYSHAMQSEKFFPFA
jgi:hypothetical protein